MTIPITLQLLGFLRYILILHCYFIIHFTKPNFTYSCTRIVLQRWIWQCWRHLAGLWSNCGVNGAFFFDLIPWRKSRLHVILHKWHHTLSTTNSKRAECVFLYSVCHCKIYIIYSVIYFNFLWTWIVIELSCLPKSSLTDTVRHWIWIKKKNSRHCKLNNGNGMNLFYCHLICRKWNNLENKLRHWLHIFENLVDATLWPKVCFSYCVETRLEPMFKR